MQNLSRSPTEALLLTLKWYEYLQAFEMSRKNNDISYVYHFRHKDVELPTQATKGQAL
jgi:hypothetical protein